MSTFLEELESLQRKIDDAVEALKKEWIVVVWAWAFATVVVLLIYGPNPGGG